MERLKKAKRLNGGERKASVTVTVSVKKLLLQVFLLMA